MILHNRSPRIGDQPLQGQHQQEDVVDFAEAPASAGGFGSANRDPAVTFD